MKRAVLAVAAAAGAIFLLGVVASIGARHVSSSLLQILSPVPTKDTVTTGSWNGLPVGYKFDPFEDMEHTDDKTSANPWSQNGQFGMWMGIRDDTINGFGCGPNGPMDCSVGTTPSEHYARKGSHSARNQKLLVGSFRIDTQQQAGPKAPHAPMGFGNQAAHHATGFFNTKDQKKGHQLRAKKGTQSLAPVPTGNTHPTGSWNGLPEEYKFNPFTDMEHNDRVSEIDPWKAGGQYGMWMGIQDDTINGFGCGPNGPLDCSVGTTPSEHWARPLRIQRQQQELIAAPVPERVVYV